jgi:NAD(P)H-hydrate epimerase
MGKIEILTAADMAETDRRTLSDNGVPITTLMENAGASVATFIERQYPGATRILVLCGKGNNGGDGLVAARALAPNSNRQITVALLAAESDLKGPPAEALAALLAETPSIDLLSLTDPDSLASLPLASFDLVVDAVLGTGFKPPLRGLAVNLRDQLATLSIPVVAVDLPSGWDADSTEQGSPDAFRASAVVTFTAPKLAHVFGHLTPGNTFGPVVVADIGSPASAVVSTTNLRWTGASKSLAEQPRDIRSNKGKFGHILLIGGSYGTAGAPSMSSLAALRAGAGLVTAAVPESILNLVAAIAPELMLAPLTQGAEGAADLANLDRLDALTKKITVIAIGPGLSTKGDASEFARQIVARTDLPLVLDADGLNAFDSTRTHLLDGTARTLVLTPHPGEFARLTGLTVKEVEADRLNLARDFATRHQLTLVLKGWRTLVAHPDGTVAVNTSGNPSMAKGGSGDILTGIVAALLAQFPDRVAEAVEAAVYLHGLAGDFAAHAMDEHTVLATDTVAHLSDAFRYRVRDADGLIWIAGLHK